MGNSASMLTVAYTLHKPEWIIFLLSVGSHYTQDIPIDSYYLLNAVALLIQQRCRLGKCHNHETSGQNC